MAKMVATRNFRGAEGWIRRGDQFNTMTEDRAALLEAEGRAYRVKTEAPAETKAAEPTPRRRNARKGKTDPDGKA